MESDFFTVGSRATVSGLGARLQAYRNSFVIDCDCVSLYNYTQQQRTKEMNMSERTSHAAIPVTKVCLSGPRALRESVGTAGRGAGEDGIHFLW